MSEAKMNYPKRGEIYYITTYKTTGNEQQTGRPAVIVSNNKANEFSGVYEVCFLTLQEKTPLPTHVYINQGSCNGSTVLCEQITTVSEDRVGDKKCDLPPHLMAQIDLALLNSLGISFVSTQPVEEEDLRDQIARLEEKASQYERMYDDLLNKVLKR